MCPNITGKNLVLYLNCCNFQHLQKATDSYLTFGDGPFVVDILKEMTSRLIPTHPHIFTHIFSFLMFDNATCYLYVPRLTEYIAVIH